MFNSINSNKQGDIGLGAAIGHFTGMGYTVSIPLTDSQDYDLVVDIGSVLKKIQVETTTQYSKYGIPLVNLAVSGGNRSGTGKRKFFNKDLVDILFVLTDSGRKFHIPTYAISAKRQLNLGDDYLLFEIK